VVYKFFGYMGKLLCGLPKPHVTVHQHFVVTQRFRWF